MRRTRTTILGLAVTLVTFLSVTGVASAAPIWNVGSEAMPTVFRSGDGVGNDAYYITLENIGDTSSSGTVTLVDKLPAGVTTSAAPGTLGTEVVGGVMELGKGQWRCSGGAGQSLVTCTGPPTVEPLTSLFNNPEFNVSKADVARLEIPVQVSAGTVGPLENRITVEGGGARSVSSVSTNSFGSPPSTFGVAYTTFHAVDDTGQPMTQAGGHPWALTTAFQFNQALPEDPVDVAVADEYENAARTEEARTIVADLPLGLLGDPLATPRCSQRAFSEAAPGIGGGSNLSACPSAARVGVASLQLPGSQSGYQLDNLTPPPGHAAEFGFHYEAVPITFFGDVARTTRGYVLRITAPVPQANIHAVYLTFFGDPASAFKTGEQHTAFLTNPADCGASEEARQLQLHFDTWTMPGQGDPFNADFADANWIAATATLPAVEHCAALMFTPSLSLQPAAGAEGGSTQADSPSGYNVDLQIPQTEEYSQLASPELKAATVKLPVGLSLSPSAAGGLQACSNAQLGLESEEPGSCPLASQLGTVKVTTPLLDEALGGAVYLAAPECASGLCTEADGSDGKAFRLFIEVKSEKLGITIKLPGVVKASQSNGQLTAEFAENPQLPFSDLELHFKNGPRAPLANPQTCGTFTTVSDLEPWSAPETSTATSESPFAITGCGTSLGFTPGFSAGMSSPTAAGSGTFSVSFSRKDGEQDLGGVTVQTPPGLLERMEGVVKCGESEANAGTCPAASQIGMTTVSAGAGSNPYTIGGGRVYLTGPYKGAPFGLAITVPAEAGPFHLAGNTGRGLQVVRAAVGVNPTTATLAVTSDPLPQIIDGVPIRLRRVNVEISRPGFMLNATNCSINAITAILIGEHPIGSSEGDKTDPISSPYAANGCSILPFKPSFRASTSAKVSKGNGASLDVKIVQRRGEANVHRVDVQLPKILPARLQPTLNHACGEAQFAANPAGCPADAFVGTATAVTPALNVPLTGPAIFVSHGAAAFPDLDVVLQGEGVTIDLTGHTQIKNGVTYSRFESVPDAPISSFELNLPEGPHSAVSAPTAKGSLCGDKLELPTAIEGQNGAVFKQTTLITVSGCRSVKPITRAQKLAKALRRCRRQHEHSKMRRRACERNSRRRYAAKKKVKKTNGKAGR